jgi:hypothetical protein
MRFWNEMQDKYGFADGEAMPEGMDVFRAVYIRAVNALAAQLGSIVRAVTYDRPGIHNSCLILFYRVSDLKAHNISLFTQPIEMGIGSAEPDELMEEAILQADLMNLDDFVEVQVSITDKFTDFLLNLRPVNEDEPLIVTVSGQPQHCYPAGKAKLVHEVRAFDGSLLPSGSEYRLTWLDHYACLAALAGEDDAKNIAIVDAAALVVTEIPAEVRSKSVNNEPIPPFHLCDLNNEILDDYGTFLNLDDALQGLQCAVRERMQTIQLTNGYRNAVTALAPGEGD